jgi:hypothetical protein
MPLSWMWHCVVLVKTGILEDKNLRARNKISCNQQPKHANSFHYNDGSNTFLRNVSSYKSHTASHSKIRRSMNFRLPINNSWLISCFISDVWSYWEKMKEFLLVYSIRIQHFSYKNNQPYFLRNLPGNVLVIKRKCTLLWSPHPNNQLHISIQDEIKLYMFI